MARLKQSRNEVNLCNKTTDENYIIHGPSATACNGEKKSKLRRLLSSIHLRTAISKQPAINEGIYQEKYYHHNVNCIRKRLSSAGDCADGR